MLNQRTWHDDLAELHAIAAAEEDFDFQLEGSEQFISLSAASDSTKQLSALRPVSLDPSRDKEYNAFFFPKDSAKSGGGKEFLLGAFQDMSDVTTRLNAFFAFMRAILADGRNIFRVENDKEALQQRIELLYQRAEREIVNTANASESTKSFLGAFMGGHVASVVKSDIYKGGLDVTMSGGGTASEAPHYMFGGVRNGDRPLPAVNQVNRFYSSYGGAETERLEAWSTPTCLKVQKAAREILEFLYGDAGISHKIRNRTLPFNTKFEEIETIFEKHVPVTLPKTIVRSMTYSRPSIEQFICFDLFRFPSQQVLDAATISTKDAADMAAAGKTLEGEDRDGLIAAKINDVNNVVPEAELLNGNIRSTPRFTFEEDIARFITQAPENKLPSLYVMNNWFSIWSRQFMRTKGSKKNSALSMASLTMAEIPRYILPASSITNVTAARKAEGLVTENTRANEDGLYLAPNGTIQYRPDSKVRDELNTAVEYETLCEELYALAGANKVNVNHVIASDNPAYFPQISKPDFERIQQLVEEIKSYAGSVISWDWDYGIAVKATKIPGVLETEVQIGAKKPDSLAIADYLGMNLADPNSPKPVQKDFASAMYMMTTDFSSVDDVVVHADTKFGGEFNPAAFATSPSSPIQDILTYYFQNVFVDKRFMSLQELAAQAMRNLGYGQELPLEGKDASQLYMTWFTTDGAPKANFVTTHSQCIAAVCGALASVMSDAAGQSSSSIYREILEESGGGRITRAEMNERIKEHDGYFSPHVSPMHEFGKLYSYFGGQILKLIFDEINKLTPEELVGGKQGRQTYETVTSYGRTQVNTIRRMTNSEVMEVIKPISVMLGKYVPNKETLFEQAHAQMESIGKNENFTADDLIVPGMQDNRAVFPHQLDTQSYLRKKEPPPFAILAISPGGGKTGIGAMDMAALAGELLELNTRVKPLVIAPDNLIKTWCDDIKYFLGDTWNAIPISTAIMARWGAERLQAMMDNAPPNSIFITGMAFMSNARQNVVIGTSVVRISGHQEFIKRLAPNYIIIDESHKLKNGSSQRHKIVKAVTTATFVKWLRIASGTLMPNTPSDLEAQVNLYSPHIFRAGELSDLKTEDAESEENKKLSIGGSKIPTWQAGTPSRAREKLGRYAAVVYKKRKEWAWMLPSPIEQFHAIPLVDKNATGDDRMDQELHEMLYAQVLEITEKGIKELFDKAKSVNANRKGSSSDESEEKMDENTATDSRVDDVAEGLPEGVDAEAFKEYMARFERMIIAPEFDPLYPNVFGTSKRYTSLKARYIAQLAREHFNPPEWNREGVIPTRDEDGHPTVRHYNEYDLVQYKGDWYLARKYDSSTDRLLALPDETVGISPDKNPDVWKKEPHGKLIIITRYTNSAQAVFDALPADLRDQATVFTGKNKSKWKGFEEFKTDARCTILIANEQGMSEGHNLQMASRIIRAESPWGPGELDQTSARIFRPDPKGATAKADGKGELYRDIIYLDWVLADNTMEVAKQARLISKIFSTTRVEESENPLYQSVFKKHNVPTHEDMPELGMGLEALRNRSRLRDHPYAAMSRAYAALNGVERAEFNEMRVNGQAGLIAIAAQPSLPGSAKINTPFVANQDIPDPHNWKPITIEKLISSNEEIRLDPDKGLIGLPVITDFGTGRIVSIRKRDNPDSPVSSVQVKFKNPIDGEVQTLRFDTLGAVYTPSNPVSTLDWNEHFEVSTTYKAADLNKEKALEKKAREQEEEKARRKKAEDDRAAKAMDSRIKAKAAGDKRKENIKEGKPINQGVTYDANVDKKIKTGITAIVKGDNTVRVHPAFNHGYLTLEGEFNGPDVNLKKLGFKFSGEYAFISVKRYNNLAAIFDYLEEHFELSKQTEARLNDVQDAFEPGKRGLYSLELAAPATMPMFFATRKKIVTNRKEIRIYPIFMADELVLAVDTATSPAILKHIGKTVPGAAAKWQLNDGHWFYFAQGKTDVKDKMAEIKRNGYVISNEKEANKELAEIKFRKARAPASK